jgi:hypothetical protein
VGFEEGYKCWREKSGFLCSPDPLAGDVENFSKWPNAIFKIPDMLRWHVVVTESRVIEEIRKAPDGALSIRAFVDEVSSFVPVIRSMKTCLDASTQTHYWGASWQECVSPASYPSTTY